MPAVLRTAFAPVLVLILLALLGVVMVSQVFEWAGASLREIYPTQRH